MNKISSKDIRDRFLEFFKEKDHMVIENSSIIPCNDPTLLFINSGMAPLKKLFTGEKTPPSPRLCNIQPCIRTIDIDEIGDKHHLTSFQMLGSWSINDYFKEKAVSLAFEFLTKRLEIPLEKLYVTIFSGDSEMGLAADDEVRGYWEKVGIMKDHIVACGKSDNFWGPTSDTGPCGPCTEVFYDTGNGQEYKPGGVFDTKRRYIEIWNAGVFIQFSKSSDGTYSKLNFTSVDTGAGLERLSMVLNGYSSVYETDLLCPIKDCICSILGNKTQDLKDVLIMTDHLRTAALILSEGICPSNEGRGYIPRRLIRKCIMLVSKLGINDFDFQRVIDTIINTYAGLYPDFLKSGAKIISEFNKERQQFEKVIQQGLLRLEDIKKKSKIISGDDAFELSATFGLPFDIIKEYSIDYGLWVDEQGYIKKIKQHKDISRKSPENKGETGGSQVFDMSYIPDYSKTDFRGYEVTECRSQIMGLVKDKKNVNKVYEGDEVAIILNASCMYAESGGQCADKGHIYNDSARVKIEDVQKNKDGIFVHIGKVELGQIGIGDMVVSKIDQKRRLSLAKNHTSVHLLQSALRDIYGKEVNQAGSKVEEGKLRFDFNLDGTLSLEDIFKIEQRVNSYISMNLPLKTDISSLSEAVKNGAIALFENKYSDKVRVVCFGDISKELCGGTHTSMTGNIGLFTIISTESIGKGIRRITAVTGQQALDYINRHRVIVAKASELLKVSPDSIVQRIENDLLKKGTDVKPYVKEEIKDSDIEYIKPGCEFKCAYVIKSEYSKNFMDAAINIADKINGVFLCISGAEKKRIILAVGISEKNKLNAGTLIKSIMDGVGGKGGGSSRIGSGGTDADNNLILSEFKKVLEST